MFHRSNESPHISVFPETVTRWAGSIWVSSAAAVWVVGTISVGVATNFPLWWQITVYSAGALISVLMLFLLQHTTNRHTNAILVKLDELIKATSSARNEVIGIEDQQLDEQEELSNELSDRTVHATDGRHAPRPKESSSSDAAAEPSASADDCSVPAAGNSS